jgi:hypothetical protein
MGLFKPNIKRLSKKKNVDGLIKALRNKDSLYVIEQQEHLAKLATPVL